MLICFYLSDIANWIVSSCSCSCSCVVCLRIHMCVFLFVYFYTVVWLVSCVLPNIGEINLIYLVKHFCQKSCATVCYTTVDTFLFFHVYYMPVPGDTGGNVSVYSAIWTTIVSRQYNSSQENLWKLKKIYLQCMIIPSVDSFKLREKTLLFVTTVFCDIYKWKTTLGALKPTTTATTVKSQNDLLKTRRNGRVFHSWHTASKTHPKRVSKWRMMLMVGGVAVSRYVFMLSSPVLTQFLRRTDSDLQL